jgi:hypothetical protein
MARLVLIQTGTGSNGLPNFQPADKAGEDMCSGKTVIVCEPVSDKCARTELQRKAQHLYFSLLAKALNDKGWDMKATMEVLSKNARIPWSMLAIKERLWKPVQKDTYGKASTTELNTDQVGPTYEALNLVTSEKLGVSVQFPDRYNQMIEQLDSK